MSNICGNCKHFYCEGDGRCCVQDETWTYSDDDACEKFENQDTYAGTRFRKITASPEVLAEEFVEIMYNHLRGEYQPFSMLTYEFYEEREEAIAATVAKLEEMEK
jgi:hypothetical protein